MISKITCSISRILDEIIYLLCVYALHTLSLVYVRRYHSEILNYSLDLDNGMSKIIFQWILVDRHIL